MLFVGGIAAAGRAAAVVARHEDGGVSGSIAVVITTVATKGVKC